MPKKKVSKKAVKTQESPYFTLANPRFVAIMLLSFILGLAMFIVGELV